jgi:hypothetical protein
MPNPVGPDEITRLLHAWQGGSSEAQAELWPILYGELKKLARGVLRSQGRGARQQATSLVHKAYLRLPPAQRAGRVQPRAEAPRPMPWVEKRSTSAA